MYIWPAIIDWLNQRKSQRHLRRWKWRLEMEGGDGRRTGLNRWCGRVVLVGRWGRRQRRSPGVGGECRRCSSSWEASCASSATWGEPPPGRPSSSGATSYQQYSPPRISHSLITREVLILTLSMLLVIWYIPGGGLLRMDVHWLKSGCIGLCIPSNLKISLGHWEKHTTKSILTC